MWAASVTGGDCPANAVPRLSLSVSSIMFPSAFSAYRRRVCSLALSLSLFPASHAAATWSIILVDTRTGEVAIGSATCLTAFDLQANTPVVLTGIGGATAQSAVDSTGQNRVFIRDRLLLGADPASIISGLSTFDTAHQSRQYGIVDTRLPGHAATFTGSGAGQYRGGLTRRLEGAGITGGDILLAVQGNVLTGAPVIDAAVQAIIDTPGDLPERLMAGMEAARALGGDGRCSCNVSNPTSCGSPPPTFTKSAHIAYMIVARAGDRDGGNGLYRVGTSPQSSIAADLNNDGKPDLITTNSTASSVSVNLNLTPSFGAGIPVFSSLPTNSTVASSPRDLAAADLNFDGFLDLAVCNLVSDSVSILLGHGNGTFQTRVNYPAGDGPIALAAADFDGDADTDLAIANQAGGGVTILANNSSGVFSTAQSISTGAATASITTADIDNDADLDLIVGATGANVVAILINQTLPGGAPSFAAGPSLSGGRGISGVAAGDFNRDGLVDLAAAATTDNRISVLLQASPSAWNPAANYTVAPAPTGLFARDVTGDGILDLVTIARQTTISSLAVLPGVGDGTFLPARLFLIGMTPGRFSLADLNGDADLDAVLPVTSSGASAMIIENLGVKHDAWVGFNRGLGTATGDYFMDFNIANQQANDPDPVFTLRDRFNQWRQDTAGHPDAVRTIAFFDRNALPADGASTARLTIIPRDWRNLPVTLPIDSVEIERAPSSDGVTSFEPVMSNGDGTFSVIVQARNAVGADRFIVRLKDAAGGREITLMPPPTIGTFILDLDNSGSVTSVDLFLFLQNFALGNADINRDGVTDSQDFFAFLAAFFG